MRWLVGVLGLVLTGWGVEARALSLAQEFKAGKRIAHDQGATNYPSGVTVDPKSGDVYVMDLLNNQIVRFNKELTFVTSWKCKQGLGIVFDPVSNTLWVAMWTNEEVHQYDPTGKLLKKLGTGKRSSEPGHFDRPHDVSVDQRNGDLYVLDTFNKRVQVFNKDGKFLRQFGNGFDQPFGIAVHPKGEFLIVANTANRELIKYSLDGTEIARWKRLGSAGGEFRWPRNVSVDEKGQIYVADTDNERAQVLDKDGNFIRFIQGPNDRAHGSFHPRSIEVGADGRVFAAAAYASRVDRFNADGSFDRSFAQHSKEGGVFNTAKGVAVSPITGDIFVSDWMDHRIKVFDKTGKYKHDLDGWFEPQTLPDGTELTEEWRKDPVNGMWCSKEHQAFPGAMAFDKEGDLWWNRGSMHYDDDPRVQADWLIREMKPDGTPIRGWGHKDFPRNARMRGLDIDAERGFVYVGNSFGNSLMKFNLDGVVQWSVGTKGSGNGQLDFPTGVAVDPRNGQVIVVDSNNNRLVRYSTEGQVMGVYGSEGTEPGKFRFSEFSEVAVDEAGRIWVADSLNHRIQALSPEGAPLLSHGEQGFGGWGKYTGVAGLGVHQDRLYVVDNSGYEVEVYRIVP